MATHALESTRRTSRRLAPSARLAGWWRVRRRRAMAESIERALEQAGRSRGFSAAVAVRAEALGSYDELLALVALLRTAPAPPPRALALCRRLVLDGTSPLFNHEAAGTLRGAVNEALHAFDADHETYPPEA
jgi:hypothetical protein